MSVTSYVRSLPDDAAWHEREEMMRYGTSQRQTTMTADTELPLFLEGFLHQFHFRPEIRFRFQPKIRSWVIDGAERFWNRPGEPTIPHEELSRFDTLRLRWVLRELVESAYRRHQLGDLTELGSSGQAQLLRRIGLGHLL